MSGHSGDMPPWSRDVRSLRSSLRAGWFLTFMLAACGAEEPPDAGVPTGDASESSPAPVTSPDSTTIEELQPTVPTVPGEGEPRVYRLLLVNALDRDTYVSAAAGARRVLVDTVPGQDSLLVDIRVRADEVELEAEDSDGRLVGSDTLALSFESVTRWVIRP